MEHPLKIFVICVMVLSLSTVSLAEAPSLDDSTVYQKGISLLAAGKQNDAETLIFNQARQHPTVQIVFFAAVLVRSRFELSTADPIFDQISAAQPNSIDGKTAALVSAIDNGKDVEKNFKALDDLSKANPKNPLILWMVAVECRQLQKNEIGIERYQQLLKALDPGPALLHQTYGNLLLRSGKFAHALAQYDIAIKMEPAAWDYNSRANALLDLHRYDQAAAAYRKATELDPDYILAWQNWAILCKLQHDLPGAVEKLKKVDEIRAKQH